jgi:hypothetical protein
MITLEARTTVVYAERLLKIRAVAIISENDDSFDFGLAGRGDDSFIVHDFKMHNIC